MFAELAGGVLQLRVDGFAIGRLVFQPPEIESAHAIGLKRLRRLDALLEYFRLLIVAEVGVELVALGAVLRSRRARPIHFEERAGDVGDAQLIFLQNLLRFGNFARR